MEMRLYCIKASPTIGDDEPMDLEAAAPNPQAAHEQVKHLYSITTGIPTGLIHTKIQWSLPEVKVVAARAVGTTSTSLLVVR